MDKIIYTESQMEGIKEIRALNKEFLKSDQGSQAVRDFLTEVEDDEALLHRFLKGRKNRAKHAWETIKRYAEVRFDSYPEVFSPTFPKAAVSLVENCIIGVLKNRDSKGRVIFFFNGSEWDTERYTMELLTIAAIYNTEKVMLTEDCINNGAVYIQQCSGMGMKHVRQYSLPNMLRFINVFWHAFPLKVKGVYFMNAPYLLTIPYGIIKPFAPKKLQERVIITSSGKKFEALHEQISPNILPKFLGGKLENHEACDREFFNYKI